MAETKTNDAAEKKARAQEAAAQKKAKAAEAKAAGFLNRVVDEDRLDDEVASLVATLVRMPKLAFNASAATARIRKTCALTTRRYARPVTAIDCKTAATPSMSRPASTASTVTRRQLP